MDFLGRSACGGVRVAECVWRSACGGVRVAGPVVLSVVRGLLCRTASVLDVFLSAHQFRMQFPPKIILVCFSSHSCVTCVLELHAILWSHARQ